MRYVINTVVPSRTTLTVLGCALAIAACAALARADDNTAATPPATQPQSAAAAQLLAADPVMFVRRLQERLQDLDLTDQQQSRLKDLLATALQEAKSIQSQIQNVAPAARMARMALFMRQIRQQLATILTPQQMQSIRPGAAANGAAGAATRPAARAIGATDASAMPYFQRLKAAVDQLDLTDSQKAQIADLTSPFEVKIQEIRKDPALRGTGRQALTDFRDKLLEILTPEQRQQLRQQLAATPNPNAAAKTNTQVQVTPSDKQASSDKPASGDDQTSADKPGPTTKPLATDAPTLTPAIAGSAAPNFRLFTPGNAEIKLSSLAGRVVVLEFGSLSCPPFRDHVQAMAQIATKYSARVYFLIVYTKEQHPAGGWESDRNTQDGINVPQPEDLPARQKEARQAVIQLHLTTPIGVDDMDDAVTKAYNGFPDATIVIGRDGKIAARQQWTDPSGLPRLIDAALAAH